jgi:hypothetical protein
VKALSPSASVLGLPATGGMSLKQVLPLFLAFAFTFSPFAGLRGVVADLAPVPNSELGLSAAALGLPGGAYFRVSRFKPSGALRHVIKPPYRSSED